MREYLNEKTGEKLICHTAESGLRIAVVPKKGFNKTYALLCTNFGSIDRHFVLEGKDIVIPDGVAHFLEHKMFEQKDGGNAFDRFAKLGASANAFTSFDMTAYLFSAAENYEESLRHLLSYVAEPYFTDENVQKEQGIIGQEIKMYDDNPGWCVFFNMLRGLYKEHPINIDIAGTCDEIAKITKETLYTCYGSYYHPANMILCVTGNADAETVIKAVDDILPVTEFKKAETIIPKEPDEVAKEYVERKMSVATPMFCIGFKEKPEAPKLKCDAVYSVLCEMIFGKMSRLYGKLYDEGLIFGMSAAYNYGKEYAFVEIDGESKEPKKVYEAVKAEINRVKTEGLDENEIEIVKKGLCGRFIKGLNNIENIASSYAGTAFYGENYFDYGDLLMSVTKEEIEKTLKNGFSASTLSVVSSSGEE